MPATQNLQTPGPPLHHQPVRPQPLAPEQNTTVQSTETLLRDILDQLKKMQRASLFTEFSIMRLLAGVIQIAVLFCLLITVWLLLDPNRKDSSVFIALGFALLFQLMSLTFYMVHERR
jgi:hypothetical protein